MYISSYSSLPCLTSEQLHHRRQHNRRNKRDSNNPPPNNNGGGGSGGGLVPIDTNLSRFNVSPPNSVVLDPSATPPARRRYHNSNANGAGGAASKQTSLWRSKTLDRYNGGGGGGKSRHKTVTWSSDRRSNAKNFCDDRKLIKQQVRVFLEGIRLL